MKKKLLSLLMAVAMVLSLAVPVLASDIPNDGYWGWSSDTSKQDKAEQTVKFQTKMFVPTIKLTLPTLSTTDPVVLNPYRIEYVATGSAPNYLNSGGTASGGVVSATNYNQQVICPVYAIKNETNAKLNVSAEITTEVNGITLVNDHVALDETANKAMINFVVRKVSVDSAEVARQVQSVGSALGSLDAYDTANYSVITLQASNSVPQIAVMNNASLEADKANYLLMQFDGELSRNPTTPWTASDKFTTTVVYTFKPVAIADAVAEATANDVAFTIAASANPVTVTLPTVSGSTITNEGFTNFTANPSASNWQKSLNPTAIGWSIVDKGALQVALSSDGKKLEIPVAAQKTLPTDGETHAYTCVLGFKDKNNVPRTVEVTINIKRGAAGS